MISLAIIAKNEQDKIVRCIKSVPFAVDVVVVDSGSTDATVAQARACGARVFQEDWRGYRDQKQRAADLCHTDWIISLDADEALSEDLAREIGALISKGESELSRFDAYRMRRCSFHLGRWIWYGGWTPDWQTRLFDRRRAKWGGGQMVHERIETNRVQSLNSWLLHWPFDSLSEQVQTNDRYSSLGAAELTESGQAGSAAHLVLRPIGKFVECYIFKRGFLDGIPGLIIAVGAAYSLFLRYAKVWEARRSARDPESDWSRFKPQG